MQRNPALKEYEESFRERRRLIWVVTPADGPCIGNVSLFIFAKAMSSAKIVRRKNALCVHISIFETGKIHRANARDRAGAKRKRGYTANQKTN